MDFSERPAQIFVKDRGCTLLHSGSIYPPDKVTFSNTEISVIFDELTREKYQDVIISGTLDSKKDEIVITSIKLC